MNNNFTLYHVGEDMTKRFFEDLKEAIEYSEYNGYGGVLKFTYNNEEDYNKRSFPPNNVSIAYKNF